MKRVFKHIVGGGQRNPMEMANTHSINYSHILVSVVLLTYDKPMKMGFESHCRHWCKKHGNIKQNNVFLMPSMGTREVAIAFFHGVK